jgi:hypothetical protein
MIAGIQSRIYRNHALPVGIRQQIVARPDWSMSRRLARLVALILCLSLLIVFAFSQLMHQHLTSSASRLEHLQSLRIQFGSENIALLAARAQMTSKERILERAQQKYHLVVPKKEQVRRL